MDTLTNKIMFTLLLLSCMYTSYCNHCSPSSDKNGETVNQNCEMHIDRNEEEESLRALVANKEQINDNTYDDQIDYDSKNEVTDSDSNTEYIKVVDLGSTRVIMQTVKRLKNGNIVAMWCTHKDVNFSDMQTKLQLHDTEGKKLKGPIEIALRSVDINLEPLSDGSFVIYTKDIFHIYTENANLITSGKFTSCFVNYYNCYSMRITAMEDNTFLCTWHERTKNNMINFKGKYYNATGNALTKKFTIYRGAQISKCKLSNLHGHIVGITCNDGFSIESDGKDNVGIDYLTCSGNALENVNCFVTFSVVHREKGNWMRLQIPKTSEPPDVLNLGNNNFVILVKETISNYNIKYMVKIINNGNVLDILKFENKINQKFEAILTRVGDTEFLMSWRDYNGHHIESYKYNINGELVNNKEVSIVTKGSNHHLKTWTDKYGYIINWLHCKHKQNDLQEWHHWEHGYSGSWKNFQEITTSIFMVIENNKNLNQDFIGYIKN